MKSYSPKDVRVVGFFGHRGTGKTSLVEGALYTAGVTTRIGSVEQKTLTLETDPDALERQMTMHANVGFCEWSGCRIGIIDTPGDGNFWGPTNRALQVVDAGVVAVSAADGLEPIGLRAIQSLSERNAPFSVFVTKLDKENTDFSSTVEELKGDLEQDAVALSLPIGKAADFKGVVSLVSQKAYLTEGGKTREADVPDDMKDEVDKAREMLFDGVAAADDELAEKYLEEGTLTEDELARGLRAAFVKGDLVPILAGNPNEALGVQVLLDLVKAIYPAPTDRPATKGYKTNKLEEPVERTPDPDGALAGQVFRTHYDPFAGMLSYVRVWSGKLAAGADVLNSTKGEPDRPSHMYLPQGGTKNGVEVKEATVGDLVAITKLKHTGTGDTLTTKDDPTCLPPFDEPEALLNYGISAGDQKAEEKMASAIQRIVDEDPALRFERDPESKETLLGGLGQAHIDYVVDKLKRAGIDIELREPKIPYRETFRAPIQNIEGKHKKQTGGAGQFGVCYVHFEPQPRGTGIEFEDQIVGGAIPRQYIPSVEKGVREGLSKGPISGNQMVDVKVVLYDGKYHPVDSKDVAFQAAGRKAVKAAYAHKNAKPVLLEPYMEVDILCPAEVVGDVMGDLNSRRARVNNMTTEGSRGYINALVPMAEMTKYTNVLKSITSGRGSFTMKFGRYQEAPAEIQQQVASSYQAADEDED